jgi:hypothetical protein
MFVELPEKLKAFINDFTGRAWILPEIDKWLNRSDERCFLVLGKPGSGKSMLSAWLTGFGPLPTDPALASTLLDIRSKVRALHFCQASTSNSPKTFADTVGRQLAQTVDKFAQSVATSLSDHAKVVNIDSKIEAQNAQGAKLTGVELHLELGSLTDEPAFDRVLREPIKTVYNGGYGLPLLIIVDALDESLNYTGMPSLVQLLNRLEDLPKQCKILATTRPDDRVLSFFSKTRREDLDKQTDDIREYSYSRLNKLDDTRRSLMAKRINEAAKGQFLYARLLLDDRQASWPHAFDPEEIPLPDGLYGFYEENLNREVKANSQRWHNRVKPVLSLITVAQGAGLTREQIERITKEDPQEPVEIVGQYLDGARPNGPFRLFHKSLGDFLIEKNHISARRTNGDIADYYQSLRNGTIAWKRWDVYGIMYTATHLADTAAQEEPAELNRVKQLVQIVLDAEFQRQHKKQCDDLTALQLDLQRALRAAARCPEIEALPFLMKASMGLLAFRKEELRPEPLFELALKGNAREAARRAGMFDLDANWRQAVPLTLAWLTVSANPSEAADIRDRLVLQDADPTLLLLSKRVDAALGRAPLPQLVPLPSAKDELSTQTLVANLGGGVNPELLHSEFYGAGGLQPANPEPDGPTFLAEHDGPLLVAFAKEHAKTFGDRFLRDYIGVHTGYQYVHYRQGSLWVLLEAILRHPDQEWVRLTLREVAASAMAGSTAEFQETLNIAILGLNVLSGKPGAEVALSTAIDKAINDVKSLIPQRGQADSWGFNKRRLAAFAQAAATVPGMEKIVSDLLSRAATLPYGFAGFQSPACLNLAESIQVCRPNDLPGIAAALRHALQAAHNIQDESFCARQTARVNAMQRRWWNPAMFDIVKSASDLVRQPSSEDFSTIHIVGESYNLRSPQSNFISNDVRGARTLQQLALVYHHPVEEFLRVNGQRFGPSQPLNDGEPINVPDPGFATQLAARFAAQALAQPGIDPDDRVAIIRSLTPLASANATILDTVLARLLIAARPDGSSLDLIEQLCKGGSEPQAAGATANLPA